MSQYCGKCVLALLVAAGCGSLMAQQAVYQNPKATPAERAHDLVGRMTLDEKAAQLEDYATAIPRLGIPDYQTWSEALHGVARAGSVTVFPQAIGMGATWDRALVTAEGGVISTEGRAKYNQAQREGNRRIFFGLTYWSPNINIFRDPRWGRGQETYGEDPYLTGQMGTAFIRGVQGDDLDHLRAVATSKHFAVHSGPEPFRHEFNVNPSPRDLEETYLPAFRTTVVDGKVQSIMCAYNSIDDFPACTNENLLKTHLREAWGFKGFVVSDCGAIVDVFNGHKKVADITAASAMSLKAGTDLSCSIWAPGFNTLADAVRKGMVKEELVTQAAERLYTARFQLGLFDEPGTNPLDAIGNKDLATAESRELALKAAKESIVLLKNDGTLPLAKGGKKIAVVGPTADLLPAILGNYVGTPVDPVTPLDGMKQEFGSVVYAQGATLAKGFEVPVPRTAFADLKAEFFAATDCTGRPVATEKAENIQTDWENALPVPQLATHDYSVRWTGTIAVPAKGHYSFSLESGDSFPYSPKESYRVVVDGKVLSEGSLRQVSDISAMGAFQAAKGASPTAPPIMQFAKPAALEMDFADTMPHAIVVEYAHSGDNFGGGVTLKWEAPAQAQIDEAVAAAKQADAVVAFVGLSPQLEGEEMRIKIDGFNGGDRTSINLPAAQQAMLEALAATGKPLVVVMQSGSAIAATWAAQHANAVLEAWYPGTVGGKAVAETLSGLNNPSGRLPLTFYASLDGLPDFKDYSMKNRTYRYYTGKPLWGFGYGLSYTNFSYGAAKLESAEVKAGDAVKVSVTVTNSGKVAGDEVVEAYLKTPQVGGPLQSLVGFERVHLEAGASKDVTLTIDPRQLSSVDEKGSRNILAGSYKLTVAGAQPQEAKSKAEVAFKVTGTKELSK